MLWIAGALRTIILGAALGVIGLSFDDTAWAIVGGILVLVGIFWLVAFPRGRLGRRAKIRYAPIDPDA
jgi:hypothetical protein